MSVSSCLCVCMSVCLCVCVCLSSSVLLKCNLCQKLSCVCLRVCVWAFLSVCVSVYVFVSVCLCLCVCICLLFTRIWCTYNIQSLPQAIMCVFVCLRSFMSDRHCLCVCLCVCMSVCVSVCLCLCLSTGVLLTCNLCRKLSCHNKMLIKPLLHKTVG